MNNEWGEKSASSYRFTVQKRWIIWNAIDWRTLSSLNYRPLNTMGGANINEPRWFIHNSVSRDRKVKGKGKWERGKDISPPSRTIVSNHCKPITLLAVAATLLTRLYSFLWFPFQNWDPSDGNLGIVYPFHWWKGGRIQIGKRRRRQMGRYTQSSVDTLTTEPSIKATSFLLKKSLLLESSYNYKLQRNSKVERMIERISLKWARGFDSETSSRKGIWAGRG